MRVSGSLQVKFFKEYARKKNRTYEPQALAAEMKRHPEEWFNPVVQENMEKLADMVAEMNADRTVNATKILIR